LRGRRLHVVATELGVPLPAIEQFVSGGARLTPALMSGLARLLEPPAPPIKSTPIARNAMKLNARSLKVTAVLDCSGLLNPGSSSTRVALEIAVGGRTFTADIAAKSARKCRATIAEHGAEKCVLLIQGRLEGNAIHRSWPRRASETAAPGSELTSLTTLTPNEGE
jgi:predicted O-methyltransferase YrrM